MKRRLSSILAAAVLGVSALAVAAPSAAFASHLPGAPYVAVGDSVASGNGLVPYQDESCLRSDRSYPTLLAKQRGVSVVSAACSGATTSDTLGQIETLHNSGALGSETELVTVTVGVNNVEFDGTPGADWGDALVACSNLYPSEVCGPTLQFAALPSLAGLPLAIAEVIKTIRAYAPTAQIVVTGYPLLFAEFTGTCNVGLLDVPDAGIRTQLSFTADRAALINEAILAANALISAGVDAAGDPNAVYVDVNAPVGAEGFAGHGLCASGQRWISGLLPHTAQTADRGFHPSAAGQRAYADIIAAAIGQ
jgi:lysophospholipase L1-like esterase